MFVGYCRSSPLHWISLDWDSQQASKNLSMSACSNITKFIDCLTNIGPRIVGQWSDSCKIIISRSVLSKTLNFGPAKLHEKPENVHPGLWILLHPNVIHVLIFFSLPDLQATDKYKNLCLKMKLGKDIWLQISYGQFLLQFFSGSGLTLLATSQHLTSHSLQPQVKWQCQPQIHLPIPKFHF